MLSDVRAVLGWLDGRLRLRWALLVPIMGGAALLEAVAAIAVFGLFRVVVEPDRIRTMPFADRVWRFWPSADPSSVIAGLTVLVALFYAGRALYLTWAEWVKESAIAESATQAADRLFAAYLAADYPFHLTRRSSQLIQEVARSTDVAFQLLVGSLVNLLAEIATIGVLVAVLAVTAPPQALAAVALVLALAAVPTLATRRVWVRAGERLRAHEAQQLHVLQQSLGAVKEVKIAGREAFFEARLRAARRALARTKQHRQLVGTGLRLGIETVLILALLGVVLLVILSGTSTGDAMAMLALFAYAGFRIVPSANRIMLNAGALREGQAFVQGALADGRVLQGAPVRTHAVEPPIDFTRALVCDDVSFAYEAGGRPALRHVHLTLRPGESLGIVGETGAGKSTLVDVLLGLLRPTSGRVLLDGDDLAGRERAWQRLVGYVPQDPYLLDDTVRRNIAFGVPDSGIDEHRLARAASLAHLDEVIRQLPDGYDTTLGERGTRLSGGQRQRVAIARALYADPAVLVFDEATAALDNQTEREVTAAIAALHGERTLIVIAHRLSTVQACDRLIFLQDGRVAAVGTYRELLGNPVFRSMAMVEGKA